MDSSSNEAQLQGNSQGVIPRQRRLNLDETDANSSNENIFNSNRMELPNDNNLPVLPPGPSSSSVVIRDDTKRDTEDLLHFFTRETLNDNSVDIPHEVIPRVSNRNVSVVGKDLRRIADSFAQTPERSEVRKLAENFDPSSMSKDDFFTMCYHLFSDGKITTERIISLFVFIGDIALFQSQSSGFYSFLRQLMQWAFSYILRNICGWVQQAGGWGAVLNKAMNIVQTLSITGAAITVIVAGVLNIVKTVRRL